MTYAISATELRSRLATEHPPLVIDVRGAAAFREADCMISGALRRRPDEASTWAAALPMGRTVVVYCVRGHEVSQSAAAMLNDADIPARYLEGGIAAWKETGGALDRKPVGPSTRWITRERPKIDRIACPWLVSRFVDPDAEFHYVPAHEVLSAAKQREAEPYDIPGVHFGHAGELCSFDAFVRHYRLTDPALQRLALIVRAADTSQAALAAQAPGLLAISQGLSRNFPDDHAMLKHGMVIYDALYTWCKED